MLTGFPTGTAIVKCRERPHKNENRRSRGFCAYNSTKNIYRHRRFNKAVLCCQGDFFYNRCPAAWPPMPAQKPEPGTDFERRSQFHNVQFLSPSISKINRPQHKANRNQKGSEYAAVNKAHGCGDSQTTPCGVFHFYAPQHPRGSRRFDFRKWKLFVCLLCFPPPLLPSYFESKDAFRSPKSCLTSLRRH